MRHLLFRHVFSWTFALGIASWALGNSSLASEEGKEAKPSTAKVDAHKKGESEEKGEKSAEKSGEKAAEKSKEKKSSEKSERGSEKGGSEKSGEKSEKSGNGERAAEEAKARKIVVASRARSYLAETHSQKGCLVDQTAIDDIRKIREDLEAKKKELASKESDLKTRELALSEEIKKLIKARDDLAAAQDIKKKVDEEKLNKLVETLLTMSPKVSSKLLASVDEELAVAAIYRMDTARLGKILNVMETSTSSKLSELMVGLVKKNRAVAAMENPEKGGEKRNDRPNDKIPAPAVSVPQSTSSAAGPSNTVTSPPSGGPVASK